MKIVVVQGIIQAVFNHVVRTHISRLSPSLCKPLMWCRSRIGAPHWRFTQNLGLTLFINPVQRFFQIAILDNVIAGIEEHKPILRPFFSKSLESIFHGFLMLPQYLHQPSGNDYCPLVTRFSAFIKTASFPQFENI